QSVARHLEVDEQGDSPMTMSDVFARRARRLATRLVAYGLVGLCAVATSRAHAELSAEELAKLAQNPIGNLISVPFQYNANLNYGPEKGTQSILNIQPVYPISVSENWNIITRTILPVVWLPSLAPGDSSVSRISDLQFTAF